MNTFINEICTRPEKSENEKIPSGAITGNGDIAVMADDEKDDFLVRISKRGFRKFDASYPEGVTESVGSIRIGNAGLEKYHIIQNMRQGLLVCEFSNANIELFVSSDNNIIYIELSSPDNGSFPSFDIEIPETSGSRNFSCSDNGIKWFLKKYDGKSVTKESAVAVCCRRLETKRIDGIKSVRFCVAAASNFDSTDYVSKSISLALNADYEFDKIRTKEHWQEFFSNSGVSLPFEDIEKIYNGSLYLSACRIENKDLSRLSLFGSATVDDRPILQTISSSGKKNLKIARYVYFSRERRFKDDNSFLFLPRAAMLGVNPDYIIKKMKRNIKKFSLPNMIFNHANGCMEYLSSVPSAVNEMLMRSRDGIIKVFPGWNKNENASFNNLMADGGFLVSASLKKGKIDSLKIKSLEGRACRAEIPENVRISVKKPDGKRVKFKKTNNYIEFKTEKNESYILI